MIFGLFFNNSIYGIKLLTIEWTAGTMHSPPYYSYSVTRLVVGLAVIGLLGWQPSQAELLKIGGSTGALSTIRLVADAFSKTHPQIQISIIPNLGSTGGIRAVEAGAIDIGVSGRPLEKQEQSVKLTSIEYARTPLVFATRNTSAHELSFTELTRIYSGATEHWPDGSRIRLVLRPVSDSDTVVLTAYSDTIKAVMTQALAKSGMIIAATDEDSADTLERLSGAFGSISLAQIISEHRDLRMLALNQVSPSPQSIVDGSYPFYKKLHLVLRKPHSASTQDFIEFLQSKNGRKILEANGHWVPSQAL